MTPLVLARWHGWMPLRANWQAARACGALRQQLREQTCGTSVRGDDAHPDRENIVGCVAEFALARVLGYPPPRFDPALARDRGWEFETAIGRLDVKGCAKPPWFLPAKDSALAKHPGADFFCLAWCPKEYRYCFLVGFATRAQMDAGEHVTNVLYGTNEWPGIPGRIQRLPLYPGRALIRAIKCEDVTFLERLQWKSNSTKTASSIAAPAR
ncbi:MAG TPA: hypothetical protein VGH59_01500 [Casimicrobiaceae bacterium]